MRRALAVISLFIAYSAHANPTFTPLGFLSDDTQSVARAVSADGSTVVGSSSGHNGSNARAFVWTRATGMVGIGSTSQSEAYHVSADGSVVVGQFESRAFRWTHATGLQLISGTGPGVLGAVAHDVSADGSIIIGCLNHRDNDSFVFRWTTEGGSVFLDGLCPGTQHFSAPHDISADGSTSVGRRCRPLYTCGDIDGMEAFIANEAIGAPRLSKVLAKLGIDLTGWHLHTAWGLSADGRTIVGYGTNPDGRREAWLAYSEVWPIPDPVCGDADVDISEECDDGGLESGDGCDANCTLTACGNGITTGDERCDDGNDASGDGCDPNCTLTGCGNSVLTTPELCDDGNSDSGDGCDSNCTMSACGNGVAAGNEQCDDGTTSSGDGCDENCTPTACGNLVVSLGERCDDGNTVSGDGCDDNCQLTDCPNGVVTTGEYCDDGNSIDDDGCDGTCQVNHGRQSRSQSKCIVNINKGVAAVVRAQSKHNEKCLERAINGQLGASAIDLDDCLTANDDGVVTRAKESLQRRERSKCLRAEPPELSLGPDRLAGSPAASALPTFLVRDLLGDPAIASPSAASGCQKRVLEEANRVFDAVWKEIVAAKADALDGRSGEPAVNDIQLSDAIQSAILRANSRVDKASASLRRRVSRACRAPIPLAIPGCEAADAISLSGCVTRAARCRACQLLLEADPRLSVDCDSFDNALADVSCL
jgi:cysteine-rich repeat protein/probable HAF family extracellular repeat protein